MPADAYALAAVKRVYARAGAGDRQPEETEKGGEDVEEDRERRIGQIVAALNGQPKRDQADLDGDDEKEGPPVVSQFTRRSLPAQNGSRSSRRRILPDGLRGRPSMKSMDLGVL